MDNSSNDENLRGPVKRQPSNATGGQRDWPKTTYINSRSSSFAKIAPPSSGDTASGPFGSFCARPQLVGTRRSHPELRSTKSQKAHTPKPILKRRTSRSSSSELNTPTTPLFFIPAEAPAYLAARNPPKDTKQFPYKIKSTPQLFSASSPYVSSFFDTPFLTMDQESDADDGGPIYTTWRRSTSNLRGTLSTVRPRGHSSSSLGGSMRSRDNPKPICTTPGHVCAGETETELDEPSRQLPTSRIVPASEPLIPPNTLQQTLLPFLFGFSRWLSIIPAVIGTIYNIYQFCYPPVPVPNERRPPERIDFFISALWSILTGWQCLCLSTGLLTRWRLYYPPLSTLIRLLALQGICWPATHLTLKILEHEKRPVITWAVIGTTTCTSRSVQIWVTSNLWWEPREAGDKKGSSIGIGEPSQGGYWRRFGGKWGGRRWDWKEVGLKCVLPAGLVYFCMAWADQLRREWSGC